VREGVAPSHWHPGKFFEIFLMPNPVIGPEYKLIEGQPNEYDVICRNAVSVPPVANDTVYLPECRSGSKIFAGTAFHRVPAPLHPCSIHIIVFGVVPLIIT